MNNRNSSPLEVNYGVVQGSTLGPLLFLVYINNIVKLNITGMLQLFADDTVIVFKGRTWQEVYQVASNELTQIQHWFLSNILTVNVSKTKFLPIALRNVSEPPAELQLVLHSCGDSVNTACHCQPIVRVDQYKYLGIIIDKKLRWEPHINYLKPKLRKMIYVFYQLG
ncbi:MAG: hypothetical protein KFE23_02290 [Candidatus Baumannia cicadellinicola]|nr:hypothetical protein [Candidatus Baumannia cicadellinicola]